MTRPPMRILHVLEPSTAGVPRLVGHMVREQASRGQQVIVLAPTWSPPSAPGVRWMPWHIDRRRPWTLLRARREIVQVCRAVEPDVVHAHSFFAGLLTRLPGAFRTLPPVVYQPHAWAFDILGGRVRWVIRAVERTAAHRTAALVTNCTDELDRGRAAGIAGPGSVVGTAVDTADLRLPTAAEREQSRTRLSLVPEAVVLVLGRVAAQKGQDQLVRAWARSPAAGTVLLLVGAGDISGLRRAAGSTWGHGIRYVGETSEVRDWLWAADVLLIPSRYETVSLVAGEAMATGLPVIATACDGIRELLGTEPADTAGVVVPLGDMAAMMRELHGLLTDGPRRRAMGRAGRTRALRYCSPRQLDRALQTVYDGVSMSEVDR